jgi:hypothetical protein
MSLPQLSAGVWLHYKGRLYQALGYGHDANSESRDVVVYIGLELDEAHRGPRLATRTASSLDPDIDAWWDFVHEDGTKCMHHDGSMRGVDGAAVCHRGRPIKPRFRYLGPGWDGHRA